MKTLQAQRLKKQAAYEYRHRREILEQIWEEAKAEAKKAGRAFDRLPGGQPEGSSPTSF